MPKENASTHLIKCPNCGKFHTIVVTPPIPRISYLPCDFCKRNIPLEYNKEINNFLQPKEYRQTEVQRLYIERLM
jgi:transposase-like protein